MKNSPYLDKPIRTHKQALADRDNRRDRQKAAEDKNARRTFELGDWQGKKSKRRKY